MDSSTLRSHDVQFSDVSEDRIQAKAIAEQARQLMLACNAFVEKNQKPNDISAFFDRNNREWIDGRIKRSLDSSDPTVLAARAKRLYQERRLREQFFTGGDIFGEPAWDILLDLMIAKCLGKQISITSACIASSVPPTTALRWISALEECGLLSRTSDENDRRRAFVTLTNSAYSMMLQYLEKIGD